MKRAEPDNPLGHGNRGSPPFTMEIASGADDIRKFDRRVKDLCDIEGPVEYAVEPRIRGLSVQLVYAKGSPPPVALAEACTQRGDDITKNIKTILSVPLKLERIHGDLPFPELLVLWGVVYVETEALRSLNRERSRGGLPPFRDSREAVDDSLLQEDPRVTAQRPLDMFCCAVSEMRGVSLETHLEMMLALQSWGLRVNRPHIKLFADVGEVIGHCQDLKKNKAAFPFEIDGALIQVNSLDLQARLNIESGKRTRALEFRFSRP
ncbi:MAG: hypothetical protein JRJ31_08695 [Deltaproteobacteria bacterium]|nr:hypothetical protein [Deltaproteobacteria bacterium]